MLEINLTMLTRSPPGCHLLHTSDPTPELYPLEIKDGHHPTDQVTWKHCTEIYEQWSNCAKGNSQITYSRQWDNWEKDKIKRLPLYLSQTPSANTATVCCWSISASAKPAVSLTNLLLQSFRAGGTGAAKVGMVLWARRTISSQLNKYWRTEEQKQARGIRDRFQAAALYAPTWPVPSSSVACSGRKQSLQHLKKRHKQLMHHHSSCHKPQMSTVWFLLSISIWKVHW